MPVKTSTINRWEVLLEGHATLASMVVASVDDDEKRIKVRLGETERLVTVEDWMALVNAVSGKVKYTATR